VVPTSHAGPSDPYDPPEYDQAKRQPGANPGQAAYEPKRVR
jgi:hypothetical protein